MPGKKKETTKKKAAKAKTKTKAKAPAKKTSSRAKKRPDPMKGTMRIRGNMRLEYATAFAEYSASESALKAATAELMLLQQDPAFSVVFKAINAVELAGANKHKKHLKVCEVARKVADKLGITYEEFSTLSVNTDTGTITPTP